MTNYNFFESRGCLKKMHTKFRIKIQYILSWFKTDVIFWKKEMYYLHVYCIFLATKILQNLVGFLKIILKISGPFSLKS